MKAMSIYRPNLNIIEAIPPQDSRLEGRCLLGRVLRDPSLPLQHPMAEFLIFVQRVLASRVMAK